MNSREIIVDALGRVQQSVHGAVKGLDETQLATQPYENGNTIAWLLWHLTRVQDNHVADVAASDQVWTTGGWADRFGLPFDTDATGYGQTSSEVAEVRVSAGLLLGYHDAVCERSVAWIGELSDDDLDRVVDESWDPPVTLGARLVSVLADDLQHAGQAAYVRGMLLAR